MSPPDPIDGLRAYYDGLSPEEQEHLGWLAIQERPYQEQRTLGNATEEQFLSLGITGIDKNIKAKAETYEEYREHLITTVKGMTEGMLDGAMYYYLQKP